MYAGCNGANYVYASCIIVRIGICGKILLLALGFAKRDFKSTWGNGKRPSEKLCIG
jgi:hypothetical protein